ncbi:MAG: alpha-amylase family glycosyl hydrolase [Solirubrobacteraceae bacterium]
MEDGRRLPDLPALVRRLRRRRRGRPARVAGRLEHVRDLGADAIWLSPIYPSPMADFGYDVADYTDVDPLFGTLADADALIERAHDLGLRVLLDFVPNHTSDRHPWFVQSRASRDAPKRGWYVWRGGEAVPNNWIATFGDQEPAWTRDAATGEWYLHSFLPQQPDLNWDEPQVEAAMHDVLRFWLARGVDGFRIDVAHRIGKDPALGDNEPGRRHDEDWPSGHERLRGIRRVLEEFDGDRMAVGEVYLLDQRALAAYVTTGDELHLAHNFHFMNLPWSAQRFRCGVDEFEALTRDGGWPAWCLNNHDHSRTATRYGVARARVAAVLVLTLRGTPFLFQGEELGMTDGDVPPEAVVDVDGRDPERVPMVWTPGPGAGFTTGTPWLPVHPDAERLAVSVQAGDPASSLELYRALLALRRATRRWRWARTARWTRRPTSSPTSASTTGSGSRSPPTSPRSRGPARRGGRRAAAALHARGARGRSARWPRGPTTRALRPCGARRRAARRPRGADRRAGVARSDSIPSPICRGRFDRRGGCAGRPRPARASPALDRCGGRATVGRRQIVAHRELDNAEGPALRALAARRKVHARERAISMSASSSVASVGPSAGWNPASRQSATSWSRNRRAPSRSPATSTSGSSASARSADRPLPDRGCVEATTTCHGSRAISVNASPGVRGAECTSAASSSPSRIACSLGVRLGGCSSTRTAGCATRYSASSVWATSHAPPLWPAARTAVPDR